MLMFKASDSGLWFYWNLKERRQILGSTALRQKDKWLWPSGLDIEVGRKSEYGPLCLRTATPLQGSAALARPGTASLNKGYNRHLLKVSSTIQKSAAARTDPAQDLVSGQNRVVQHASWIEWGWTPLPLYTLLSYLLFAVVFVCQNDPMKWLNY